MAQW
jgi:hypothetical protein